VGETERKWCVYMHKNKINNKKYIGQTCRDPKRRWQNGKGYKENGHFYNAIQKYGWDNFEHIILKNNLTSDEADFWEKFYIQQYETTNPDKGYNLTFGGNAGIPTDETRKIMSNRKKENWNDSNYRQKMISARYKFIEENPNYRSEISKKIKKLYQNPEYKTMMSNISRNILRGEDSHVARPVYCFELDESFWGAKEAEDKYGIQRSSICSCCKQDGEHLSAGVHPITGEMLHWCYLEDKDTYVIPKPKKHPCSKPIYCPELDEVFWGVGDAKSKYGINNISACLNGRLKSAGKHPETSELLHWCYLEDKDTFIAPNENESYRKGKFNSSSKPIFCVELNKTFYSTGEAEQLLGIGASSITACCKKKKKSAGKHPVTGEPLHWCYESDKDSFVPPTKEESTNSGKYHPHSKKIYCKELNEYFQCISDAQRQYGIPATNITKCCKGRQKTAGKHPVTGEPLSWQYADDVNSGEK
jgi:group I intron endonuclease